MPIDASPNISATASRFGPTAVLHVLGSAPAALLLGAIWLYQRLLSPALPVLFGPACGCRFSPTCSHYAAGAVRAHGAWFGGFLALRRLLKCTPLHPGGFDPVPPRSRPRASARSRANVLQPVRR